MSVRWNLNPTPQTPGPSWTLGRRELCRAVYEATNRLSCFAPMDYPVSGHVLRRAIDKKYLRFLPTSTGQKRLIDLNSVKQAICPRDAESDGNRFTGLVPDSGKLPRIILSRGGLYLSEHHSALIAEMMEYAPHTTGTPIFLDVAEPKCMVMVKVVRDLNLVNMDFFAPGTLNFLEQIQQDNKVFKALVDEGYLIKGSPKAPPLVKALFDPDDYSAARGFGVALVSNPDIDGMRVESAREFISVPDVSETGDNVVLFSENFKPADDKVRVISMHTTEFGASWTSPRFAGA